LAQLKAEALADNNKGILKQILKLTVILISMAVLLVILIGGVFSK
jgi:hypothetical protein